MLGNGLRRDFKRQQEDGSEDRDTWNESSRDGSGREEPREILWNCGVCGQGGGILQCL
jgi:hypothetical protein